MSDKNIPELESNIKIIKELISELTGISQEEIKDDTPVHPIVYWSIRGKLLDCKRSGRKFYILITAVTKPRAEMLRMSKLSAGFFIANFPPIFLAGL